MKISRLNKFPLLLLFAASFLMLSSCNNDDDDNSMDLSAFLGTYNVAENCSQGGDNTFRVTIRASSTNDSQIIINNLWDFEEDVVATVNGDNITIASQELDGAIFVGSGSRSGNVLTITFSVDQTGGYMEDCTAVCTKQ